MNQIRDQIGEMEYLVNRTGKLESELGFKLE